MAFPVLLRAQSYGSGHDVWVVTRDDESTLIRKMDWYANFQLARAAQHRPRELSADLKSIMRDLEIPSMGPKVSANTPLMIEASRYLPTEKLVEMPPPKDRGQWVGAVHELWMNLGKPKTRVFLPEGIDVDEFTSEWPDKPAEEISLVPHSKV